MDITDLTNKTYVPKLGDTAFVAEPDFGIVFGEIIKVSGEGDWARFTISVYIDECRGKAKTLKFEMPVGLIFDTWKAAANYFIAVHESGVYGPYSIRLT